MPKAPSGRSANVGSVVAAPRNQRYLGVALGSQPIDQLGFRRHREGCFDDPADGRTVVRDE
jgi:hypothetical protein